MVPVETTQRAPSQLDRRGRYEHELLVGVSASLHLGHSHRLWAELTLETGRHATCSLVDLGLTAPEPQLAAPSGYDLVGNEGYPDDATRGPRDRRPVEPPVELPPNPIGHGRRTESPLMAPQPNQLFSVLGLGLDGHPGAGHTLGRQPTMKFLGQRASTESDPIDAVGRRIDLGAHRPVGRLQTGIRRPLVKAASQSVSGPALVAESSEHVGRGQIGEGAQGAQAKPLHDITEIVPIEHRHRERPQKCGRPPRLDHPDRGRGAGGEAGCEGPVRHTDAHVGASIEDPDQADPDQLGHRGVAPEIARGAPHDQPTGTGSAHLDPRRYVVERGDDRLEHPRLSVFVAVDDGQLGTASLCHPPAHPPGHPLLARGRRCCHHPVGEHGGHGLVERSAESHYRPIEAPGHQSPHRGAHRGGFCEGSPLAGIDQAVDAGRRPPPIDGLDRSRSAIGARKQQIDPTGASRRSSPLGMDGDLSRPQHPVANPETDPFGPVDGQRRVGSRRPRPPDGDHHRASLAKAGRDPSGRAWAAVPGTDDNDIDGTDEGGHGRGPRIGIPGVDHEQSFERYTGLGGRRQPHRRVTHDRSPGADGRGTGGYGESQQGGARTGDGHDAAPPEPTVGKQVGQHRQDRHDSFPGEGEGADPIADQLQSSSPGIGFDGSIDEGVG